MPNLVILKYILPEFSWEKWYQFIFLLTADEMVFIYQVIHHKDAIGRDE